jgi:IPT/TIG domain/WD40-like Beta Propeller Repeat
MRSRWAALILVVAMTLVLLNCSGGATLIPTPSITSIFPDSIVAGSATFVLTVTGENFVSSPQSVVLWNGTPRATTFNSSTGQLSATILASDITNSGTGLVSVMNAPPGGTSLSATSFSILPLMKGAATITSLNPSNANPGTKGPFLLTVNGTGFIAGSIIRWNGTFRQPVTATATALTTDLTTNDLASAGIASVSVDNPLPSGLVASSISVDFTIGKGSAASPQVISVNALGGPANGRSAAPAMSADGRYVAFYSKASNLVSDGASGNIFVRDTCLGATNCTSKTSAVDVDPDGSSPDRGAPEQVAISADGRFVAFSSYATNLAPGLLDSAFPAGFPNLVSRLNVFMRDMCIGSNAPAGCTPRTEIITQDVNGQRTFGGLPSLSGDGRFVAFISGAPGLAAGAAAQETDLYVRDTCAGPTATVACQAKTIGVPLDSTIEAGHGQMVQPVISTSGRYVAYQVWMPMEPMVAQGPAAQIFLRDMCLGADAPAACVPSTVRISVAADGSPLKGFNGQPSLSSDARFVVFESQSAESQAGEPAATRSIFLRDACLGPTAPDGCTPSTKLIYRQPASFSGTSFRISPAISPSGRFISFVGSAPGTGLDTMDAGSLFIYDTCIGAPVSCTPSTYAVSAPGAPKGQPLIVDRLTPIPLSADGRFATFYSLFAADPSNPVSGQGDVFLAATPFK